MRVQLWVLVVVFGGCDLRSPETGQEEEEGTDGGGGGGGVNPVTSIDDADLCSPRQDQPCGAGRVCCSSDPATLETRSGVQRLFSGVRNQLSDFGVCFDDDAVGPMFELADRPGCPVPCNPQWPEAAVAEVCGVGRVCCQTREVDASDCAQSRPANGEDALDCARDVSCTDWAQHATAQDPSFARCADLARDSDGRVIQATFEACAERLTVADQRGFCMPADPNRACLNISTPGYTDACSAE